jgi:nucleotide-binding universal stress UspA family protein
MRRGDSASRRYARAGQLSSPSIGTEKRVGRSVAAGPHVRRRRLGERLFLIARSALGGCGWSQPDRPPCTHRHQKINISFTNQHLLHKSTSPRRVSPGSRRSAVALTRAADLAARHGSLTVVYVDDVRSLLLAWAAGGHTAPPPHGSKLGQRVARDALGRLPEDLPVSWLVRRGHVRSELARVARDHACSATVIRAPCASAS